MKLYILQLSLFILIGSTTASPFPWFEFLFGWRPPSWTEIKNFSYQNLEKQKEIIRHDKTLSLMFSQDKPSEFEKMTLHLVEMRAVAFNDEYGQLIPTMENE